MGLFSHSLRGSLLSGAAPREIFKLDVSDNNSADGDRRSAEAHQAPCCGRGPGPGPGVPRPGLRLARASALHAPLLVAALRVGPGLALVRQGTGRALAASARVEFGMLWSQVWTRNGRHWHWHGRPCQWPAIGPESESGPSTGRCQAWWPAGDPLALVRQTSTSDKALARR